MEVSGIGANELRRVLQGGAGEEAAGETVAEDVVRRTVRRERTEVEQQFAEEGRPERVQ